MVRLCGLPAFLSTICTSTLFLICFAAGYAQVNTTKTPGFKLLPGISSVPAPVRVAPDTTWMGIDGSWNTFSIRVGSQQDKLAVFVSTASEQIWAVHVQACIMNKTDPNTHQVTQYNALNTECETQRGGVFNTSQSQSWHQKGYFQLSLERRLALVGNGLYGFDSVGLGLEGEEGPSVQNATLGTLITPNFWLGHIGLNPKPTNFSVVEDPVPSYLVNLFNQKNIPSVSFGYTAGSQYRRFSLWRESLNSAHEFTGGQSILSSLTLGGYDTSRIIENDLTFIFAPDSDRDLVVGVVGLTADTSTTRNINLLKRDGVDMFIDSTVAELWLPLEVCQAFETAFGLKYDATTDLYLVDDDLHQNLLKQNPNITFTLGQKYSTQTTVQITLPYGAFDQQASAPYRGLQTNTKYFPIRRGDNSSQWVLGRTFLQEAYLTVDWERQNFSLSAVDWNLGKPANLLPIVSPKYAVPQIPPKKTNLATGAIIGIAVGGSLILALAICAVSLWFWRRRNQRKLDAIKAKYEASTAASGAKKDVAENPDKPSTNDQEDGTKVFQKAELPDNSTAHHELSSSTNEKDPSDTIEADSTEPQIYEMAGDIPVPQEAGGRQLSEKETMVVRERIYNGVDPNSLTDTASTAQAPPRQLAPITASEVTIVHSDASYNNSMSPVSPRTPNARDGAFLEANDTFFQPPPYRSTQGDRPIEEGLLSPISPMEGSGDTSRRRFSYES